MSEITITAVVEAKSGMEREVVAALAALAGPTRTEDGCLQFELHCADDSPRLFLSFARWASQDHLDRHLAQPHVLEFQERTETLLTHRPDITVWRCPDAFAAPASMPRRTEAPISA